MSKKNSQLDKEIDAGKFFGTIFTIFFILGLGWFFVWFYTNVYNAKEKSYINGARYAYKVLQDEVIKTYKMQGYVFNKKSKHDAEFCNMLVRKYSKDGTGKCLNINPLVPQENFRFKDKNISIYGLEKPSFEYGGSRVKDVIIDTNTEDEGENQVGSDRLILRIYSAGRIAAVVTPVNCSRQDEKDYGLPYSAYCIGSPEVDYLILSRPLAFSIELIGAEDGKTKVVSRNAGFAWVDCRAFDGAILGLDEYCSEKMLYSLKNCDEEFSCNITLTK